MVPGGNSYHCTNRAVKNHGNQFDREINVPVNTVDQILQQVNNVTRTLTRTSGLLGGGGRGVGGGVGAPQLLPLPSSYGICVKSFFAIARNNKVAISAVDDSRSLTNKTVLPNCLCLTYYFFTINCSQSKEIME